MHLRDGSIREVAVPASVLGSLRETLRRELGPLTAIHTLHSTGYDAGEVAYEAFRGTLRHSLEETLDGAFWSALALFLQQRGWGSVRHSAPHPGVGLLTSGDWAEADGGHEAQPACAFSVGLISHLLTQVAEAPVAVLETSCRACGDAVCSFAFGSEATIHDLYGLFARREEPGEGTRRALSEPVRVLGIDYGDRRIGLALSDPTGTIASPLETLTYRRGKRPPLQSIVKLALIHEVDRIVVGLPLDLSGEETQRCRKVREIGAELGRRLDRPVEYLDERFSSVRAERTVRSLGMGRRKREQKGRVDALAAAIILQMWLDRSDDEPTPRD